MERRVFRNYYSGHIDKTNREGGSSRGGGFGWVGIEGWGENAENSN